MEDISINIYNFNDKTVERVSLNSLLELEFVEEHTKELLNLKGIQILDVGLGVSNKKKFLSFLFSSIFKNYEIINTEGIGGGHPDYILRKDNNEIYVEIKWEDDSLRSSQVEWMWENKDKKIKIIWISSFDKLWTLKLNKDKASEIL